MSHTPKIVLPKPPPAAARAVRQRRAAVAGYLHGLSAKHRLEREQPQPARA
jgi:hypothetical protein